MTNHGSNRPRSTRADLRIAAREKAKLFREEQKKRDRRNRLLVRGSILVAVLVVVGVMGWLIYGSIKPAGPGPQNLASDGIVLTGAGGVVTAVATPALGPDAEPTPTVQDDSGDVANIVMYVDYLCPACGLFEQTNAESIKTLVEEGAATLEVHPIAILSNQSAGTQYSLRAANAAVCVADLSPESFLDYHDALFANQPAEGSTGLTDDQLKSLTRQASVSNPSEVATCIDDARFRTWVDEATNRALTQPIPNSDLQSIAGTPTVLVNGKQFKGSMSEPSEFQAFVAQASGVSDTKRAADPSSSPAPTSVQ